LDQVGISKFRKLILSMCWDQYSNIELPKLFKFVTAKNKELTNQIQKIESQISNLNLLNLATKYASLYLSISQSVLVGCAQGNPTIHGESLKEEIDDQMFVSTEWEQSSSSVPFQDTRIYGGQQFERLFSEFRSVVNNLKIKTEETTDLSQSSNQDKKHFWNACEAVQIRTEEVLIPLLSQLVERTSFVMRRVPRVVEDIFEQRNKHKLPVDNKYFGPLAAYLRDLFGGYIDKMAENARQVCMEEFYSTKTIYWSKNSEEFAQMEFSQLVQTIFDDTKKRICTNVIRKVYNFFILPFMRSEIWNEIQSAIFKLDKFALEEIFESNSMEDHLEHELEDLEKSLDLLVDQEIMLHEVVHAINPTQK